ncbi:hypothetical protein [Paracoccus sp. (in: a-proteobacteria)]|uniref:hypothetical protein n=1 Tax=Paracoccus sp. TaxID=267 RepID=UPI0026DEDEA2|nr:hypothetical protein [Paracoccus sp. (in: a-proteobacteria)]MDO5646790.1 hypothetical protein [Paracoccus sp. (in: a-proteobacteria)]
MSKTFRRHVLYLPGFDPIPPRRYRELYRREGAEQARIAGYDLSLTPRRDVRFGWQAQTDGARADIQVLVWSDLVQASMTRSIAGTYAQLVRTAWVYIASGALWRLARLRRGPVLAALYPIIVLLAQMIVAALAAWGAAQIGLWLAVPVFIGAMLIWRRLDHRIFAYYLMHDYAFTAEHRGAYPPELEQRLREFRVTLRDALSDNVDEVLIVGHSSGAYLAVSLLADHLRDAPPGGPALSLLTLGHVVPMASFLPRADRLRADLAFLGRSDRLFWLDVTAPGDACCFALCDPVAVSGAGGPDQRAPLVISAAYRQNLSPERQHAMRHRWFRRHFQYLCAFDRPENYDYFAITAGGLTLADRYAGRDHSPGRIIGAP